MKKIFLLGIFLIAASCEDIISNMGCGIPSSRQNEEAKWYYDHAGARKISGPSTKITGLFGCYYYSYSDTVYSYSTLFHEGYILVRSGKPIMSVETN